MMKRKKNLTKIMVIALAGTILFAGCNMVRNEEATTNNEGDAQILEIDSLDIDENIFGTYGGSQAGMLLNEYVTLYGGYYLFTTFSHSEARTYYLDDEYKAHLFCFDSSCTHTSNCTSQMGLYSPQYYKGDLYTMQNQSIYVLEGKTKKCIYTNSSYIENLSIRDGKFYFSDDDGICFVDMETKEKVYLTELRSAPYSLNVYNDKIYFSSDSYQLYSMNFDGSELALLSEDFTLQPQYHEGKIYYRQLSRNSIENDSLIELDLTTGESEIIAKDVYQIRVCDDAIYYIGAYDASSLSPFRKYEYEAGEIKELGEIYYKNFMVYDEYDYIVGCDITTYFDEVGNKKTVYHPYIMDKNGENKKMIELPEIAIVE